MERAIGALGAPRGGDGERPFTVDLDAVRVIETYLPGGARLIPLIYAREAQERGGVRIVLPHRYSLDKIYMDYGTAERLYSEAVGIARETLGECADDACRSMALDYVARVLTGQQAGPGGRGGGGAYTRTVSYKNFEAAVASDVREGYYPVFVMMTVNIRHMVVLLHLRLIYMLMEKVARRLARDGLRVRPCLTLLLWPLRGPGEDLVVKPELDGMFYGRYAAVMVDPDEYTGDWRLFDLVAEAHKFYFSRGATAPHNVLTNMVMEEIGEYASAQRRAYTLAHALAGGLGFPYNYTLPSGVGGLSLRAGQCDVGQDGSRPVYIYVGGMTYYATLRLMLEALALAHPGLSKSLGLKLHERLEEIAGATPAWRATDYSFRVYMVEFKRIVYAWEAVSSLRNLAYETLAGRASSKRRRPGRLARDRESLARAAAEAYRLLSSRELEGAMEALRRLARGFPEPKDEIAAVVAPLILRRAALEMKDKLAAALEMLRDGDSLDVITCRNILEGLNMLYDILALYMLTYPQMLRGAGVEWRESPGLPAKVVMPILDVAGNRYESAFFRNCRDAIIGLLERTSFLERYADFTSMLARAALKAVMAKLEQRRDAARVKVALEVMGKVSGMLRGYLPREVADEEADSLSNIIYGILGE